MGRWSRLKDSPQPRSDCTVVCNRISLNAGVAKMSDGFDAVLWLVKKNGGSMQYAEMLRELKNPRRIKSWPM